MTVTIVKGVTSNHSVIIRMIIVEFAAIYNQNTKAIPHWIMILVPVALVEAVRSQCVEAMVQ